MARRGEFRLGAASIRPASRELCGPETEASLEPRIMQVLLMLADARGAVVTRADLMAQCWSGQIVGDDALNRAISEIRRLAKSVAADSFRVETISKVGYRLLREVSSVLDSDAECPPAAECTELKPNAPSTSRRAVLLTGGGLLLSSVPLINWRLSRGPSDTVASLLEHGRAAMRQDIPDSDRQGIQFFQQAARLAPDDPSCWAGLALSWRAAAEFTPAAQRDSVVLACEDAAKRALAIDPRQADALAALALLQPEFGDWLAAEKHLHAVLAIDPRNEAANAGLAVLLQGVGRCRAAAAICMRLAAEAPLAPRYFYWSSYAQWSAGRAREADRIVDRGLELWPRHPGVWFARLWLFALTGRAPAASKMLEDADTRPTTVKPRHIALIQPSLKALTSGSAGDRHLAVATNLEAVMAGPSWAVYAIMILSQLGELDAAFEAAGGYLLRQGNYIGTLAHSSLQPSINDQRHRKTMQLFIPPTSPMRADERFDDLARQIGLTEYWRLSGRRADYLKITA